MKVTVKNNDVVKAYRRLQKKLHNEGAVRELMDRRHFTKPSDVKRKQKNDSIRRAKRDAAKRSANF